MVTRALVGATPAITNKIILHKGEVIMEQTMRHGKQYTCKRWRMLTWLMERGFNPIKTIPDATRPEYNNWVFVNSPELENAINAYFAELGKQ